MKKVFITQKLAGPGIDLLKEREDIDLDMNDSGDVLGKNEIIKRAKDADAIISLLTDKIDTEVINELDRVKVIANYAVGFDNIDIEAAKEKGIIVTNTPEVMTQAVAEHAMALMLSCSRRIVEGDRFMRGKKFKHFDPELLIGPEIAGKTLGIVGIGRIGSALSHMAYHGFGMKILYHDLEKNEDIERNLQADYASLNHLLASSDFISLHVPLLDSTRHMISEEQIKLMKKSAILVNTSRGAIIDEKALVQALKEKEIFAAGLDLTEFEPYGAPGLLELDNVVLTPHIASATQEARDTMSHCVAENVLSVLRGEKANNPCN